MLLGCNSPTPPRGRHWPLTYSPSNLDFIGRVELSSGFSNVLVYSRVKLRARNGRSCVREASMAFVARGYALREIASFNVADISRGVVYGRHNHRVQLESLVSYFLFKLELYFS